MSGDSKSDAESKSDSDSKSDSNSISKSVAKGSVFNMRFDKDEWLNKEVAGMVEAMKQVYVYKVAYFARRFEAQVAMYRQQEAALTQAGRPTTEVQFFVIYAHEELNKMNMYRDASLGELNRNIQDLILQFRANGYQAYAEFLKKKTAGVQNIPTFAQQVFDDTHPLNYTGTIATGVDGSLPMKIHNETWRAWIRRVNQRYKDWYNSMDSSNRSVHKLFRAFGLHIKDIITCCHDSFKNDITGGSGGTLCVECILRLITKHFEEKSKEKISRMVDDPVASQTAQKEWNVAEMAQELFLEFVKAKTKDMDET